MSPVKTSRARQSPLEPDSACRTGRRATAPAQKSYRARAEELPRLQKSYRGAEKPAGG